MGREAVVRLLLEKGAAVNLGNKAGSSPLHAALENGFAPVAQILRAGGGKDLGSNPDGSALSLK